MKKSLAILFFYLISHTIYAQKNNSSELKNLQKIENTKSDLSDILNSDGTLKFNEAKKATYNTNGYSLSYGEKGEPVFLKQTQVTVAGDENWDPNFARPGIESYNPANPDGIVYSILIDSDVAYVGGQFAKAGGVTVNNIAKWDGVIWSKLGSGLNSTVSDIKKYGSDIYVTTYDGVYKWTGSNWITVGIISGEVNGNLFVSGMDIDLTGNVYIIGSFLNVNGTSITQYGIAKWNGSTWSNFGIGLNYTPYYGGIGSVVVNGSDVYVGGSFNNNSGVHLGNLAKWNGSSWAFITDGINNQGGAVAGHFDGDLYVVYSGLIPNPNGNYYASIKKWNGVDWTQFGNSFNGNVNKVVKIGNNLYAAGDFTQCGNTPINKIAKWNGSAWENAGEGLPLQFVYALAITSGHFLAGGSRDISANLLDDHQSISKWNGSSWRPLTNGINDNVNCVTVDGNNVYIGGKFTRAGGLKLNRIAKWDGNKWDSLGSGLNGEVRAIAVIGNKIYAGGSFAGYLAEWNGTNWVNVGGGVSNTVYALAVKNNDLYVGGAFYQAGGIICNNIAKWNGTSWSALGLGTNGIVSAIKVGNDGNTYVGGNFTIAGSTITNRIAKWNGTAWSAMASGVNNIVRTIGISDANEIYIGGGFDVAINGTIIYGIAKWNGTTWVGLGSGLNAFSRDVHCIAFNGTDVYVGGYFQIAGNTAGRNIAKWDGTNWSILGSGIDKDSTFPSTVLGLATTCNTLYAVGQFARAGEHGSRKVAKFWMNGVPNITINTLTSATCGSSPIIFNALATNTGPSPNYQWKVNGVNIGTNSPTFTSSILNNGDQVTCTLYGSGNCLNSPNLISNVIVISLNTALVSGVTITSNSSNTCSNTPITFNASPTNGGATPIYQWKINGVNAGTNSPNFTSSTLQNNDQVKVVMTTSLTCAAPATAMSNVITMTVTSASLANAGNDTSICSGSSTQLAGSGGTSYFWSPSTGLSNANIANPIAAPATTTRYFLTVSNGSCISADSVLVTVNSSATPSVSISSSNTNVCAGTPITFTAIPINGGSSPTYQWNVNGINAGTNSPTFTTSTLQNIAQVSVVMTSSLACASPANANSIIIIAVTPAPVANAGNDVNICAGSSTQLVGSGGTTYSWSPSTGLSNANIANPVASPAITTAYFLTVFNGACTSRDTVVVTVAQSVTPNVIISTPTNNICSGSNVNFTAVALNAGTNPTYQWQVNGINAGTNSATFTSNSLQNNAQVKVMVTSNTGCSNSPVGISNVITMNVNILAQPVVSLNSNILTVTNADAAANYTWQVLTNTLWGNVIPTATGITYTTSQAGEYRVKAEKGACTSYSSSQISARANTFDSTLIYISLNPNPTTGLVTVSKIVPSQKWQSLDVINFDGQSVMPSKNITGLRSVPIRADNLPSGLYFIRLTNEAGRKISYRFIKL